MSSPVRRDRQQRHTQQRHTWSDYRTWNDAERWEIIDGAAYAMAPAPSTRHQTVAGHIFAELRSKLTGKPCRPFIAPTDVRLSETDVVQPDVFIVCNAAQIFASHIEGAPAVVIEVLSPATSARDLRQKKALYERSGVTEYIVVDPLEHYAQRFRLEAGQYDRGTVFAADEHLVIATLENIELPLWEVFELPAPEEQMPPGTDAAPPPN